MRSDAPPTPQPSLQPVPQPTPTGQEQHADFRKALAQFATGVTIITTRTADGTAVGLTANSFASVSLDPPLVLWSLSRRSSALEAFLHCDRYLIHVLAADQLELARRFATRGADRFAPGGWTDDADGLPLLDGTAGWLSCLNYSRHDEGDHVILVGRVAAQGVTGGAPLIFHDSRYITHLTESALPSALRSRWD